MTTKIPKWKRILAFTIAYSYPATIYVLFDGFNEMPDFIPFMYLFISGVAALALGVAPLFQDEDWL